MPQYFREYRIIMPMTVEEYHIAQLFTVAERSKQETAGDSGIEILENKPYEKEAENGQYTHKIYHLGSKVPRALNAIAPASSMKCDEHAWNAYPNCKTVFSNQFLGERFSISITSKHANDKGTQENIHGLTPEELKYREVITIDIANDKVEQKDYKAQYDPTLFTSKKTQRGPFKGDWTASQQPIMCCYKLCAIKFKVWGFETIAHNAINKSQQNLFLSFHRQMTCLMDEWHGLNIEDIRKIEADAKKELDAKIEEGDIPTK